MLDFIRRIGRALYECTIGSVVRLYQHTKVSAVDSKDKETVGRIVTYSALLVFGFFFPALAFLVALFRILVVTDIIRTIADIFQHTANSYAE